MGVFIRSYNQIKFGKFVSETFDQMMERLFVQIDQRYVDALFGISSFAGSLHGNSDFGRYCKENGGIKCKDIYSFTNGAEAFNAAYKFISSGVYKNILLIGAEKVGSLTTSELESHLAVFLPAYEAEIGQTYFGRLALVQRYYIEKKGLMPDTLYKIAVKNSKNGVNNEFAQFNKVFTKEQIAGSQMIADPIHLLETTSFCDGAAAMVLSGVKSAIEISSIGCKTDLYKTTLDFSVLKNGLSDIVLPEKIDVVELSDITAFTQYIIVKTLGLKCDFINLSGGLKSCGYPVGATSIRQIIDTAKHLKSKKLKNGLAVYLHGVLDSVCLSVIKNHG